MSIQMLRTWQNSMPKSMISVIQPHCGYCSSNDETKREMRERMLRIRYEQKQLYGRVIRDNADIKDIKNTKDTEPTGDEFPIGRIRDDNVPVETVSPYDMPSDVVKVPDTKLASPERENEFHWLSKTSRIKIFKMGKSQTPTKPGSSTEVPPQNSPHSPTNSESLDVNKPESTKMSPANVIVSATNLVQQFVLNRRNEKQEIPFNEADLKSIVSYPLVCEKRSSSRVHEILADRSLRLPSISKVLQGTMPESARIALRKWKLGKIAELGVDGFRQYEKETLDRGKKFHSAIENFLSQGEIPADDSPIIKLWQSIDSSLNQLKPKPVLLEQPILHADLKYQGIIDNVSIVENELCAFEWKTSEKTKPRLTSTYDAPVQLCAYLGALNADPRYDLTVKNGCVVVAYKNGDTANVFNLSEADLRKYWLVWLQRLQEYWIRLRDGTLPDPI